MDRAPNNRDGPGKDADHMDKERCIEARDLHQAEEGVEEEGGGARDPLRGRGVHDMLQPASPASSCASKP